MKVRPGRWSERGKDLLSARTSINRVTLEPRDSLWGSHHDFPGEQARVRNSKRAMSSINLRWSAPDSCDFQRLVPFRKPVFIIQRLV